MFRYKSSNVINENIRMDSLKNAVRSLNNLSEKIYEVKKYSESSPQSFFETLISGKGPGGNEFICDINEILVEFSNVMDEADFLIFTLFKKMKGNHYKNKPVNKAAEKEFDNKEKIIKQQERKISKLEEKILDTISEKNILKNKYNAIVGGKEDGNEKNDE